MVSGILISRYLGHIVLRMTDPITYVTLALSLVGLGSLVLLLRYLSVLRQASSSYRESSGVVSDIVDELDSRAMLQDKRIADIQVKLDVLEERWLRSGLSSPRPNLSQPFTARYETEPEFTAIRPMRRPAGFDVNPLEGIGKSGFQAKPTRAELLVLENLVNGRLTAPEVKAILSSSREHAARVMKSLADKGLVVRDLSKRPYSYEISDVGRDAVVRYGAPG